MTTQERNELVARGEAIFAKADAEKRPLTDEEGAEVDTLMKRLDWERWPSQRKTSPDPIGDPHWANNRGPQPKPTGRGFAFRNTRSGETVRALTSRERLAEPDSDDVRVGDLLYAALTSNYDAVGGQGRMASMFGGSDTGGGYLLTPDMSSQVIDLARSASVALRAGAQTLPMQTAELQLARISGDPTGHWRAETVAVTSSSLTFERINLRPKTLAAIVPVSIELLEDAANAAEVIVGALRAALGVALDQAVLVGDGAESEPLGIRNHSSVNTVTSVGTPADYAEVTDAVGEVLQDNYPGAVEDLAWILHPRDAETYDGLQDTTNQPMMPTPWASALKRFHTTSLPTTEGGGSNESVGIIGDFSQCVIGTRTNGVVVRVLDSGTVTDASSNTWNATSQLMRHVVAYLRADVALLQPTWFTVMSGITA